MAHTTGEKAPCTKDPAQLAPLSPRPRVPQGRGCLFALSQLPLILFLAVIGGLLLITALHDFFLL